MISRLVNFEAWVKILTHIHVLLSTVVLSSSLIVLCVVKMQPDLQRQTGRQIQHSRRVQLCEVQGGKVDVEIHGDGCRAAPDHVGVTKCRGRLPHMPTPSY